MRQGKVVHLLLSLRADIDATECNGTAPIQYASHFINEGTDRTILTLATSGCRLVNTGTGRGFWHEFGDTESKVRDPELWEKIVRKGGDHGTPESLRKRIRMLRKAGIVSDR